MRNIEARSPQPEQTLSPEDIGRIIEQTNEISAEQAEQADSLLAEIIKTAEKIGKEASKFLGSLTIRAKKDYLITAAALLTACAGPQIQVNTEIPRPRGIITESDEITTVAVDPAVESGLTEEERRRLLETDDAEALLKPDERLALIEAGFEDFEK